MPRPITPVNPAASMPEVTYAKDQPQYIPLPVVRRDDGLVTTRWRFSWKERLRLLFTGDLWLQVHTFNHPLQPLAMTVHPPFLPEVGELGASNE